MPGIEEHRKRIDEIDKKILELIEARVETAKKIGRKKKKLGMDIPDPKREKEILDNISGITKLDKEFIRDLFRHIIAYCKNEQD